MVLKKILFSLLVLFAAALPVLAGDRAMGVNFFTPKRPEISVKQNVQFNILQDSKERSIGFSTIADFDMKELNGSLGLNLSSNIVEFTTEIVYEPTFFNLFNLGVGGIYHIYQFMEMFTEQDVLLCGYFKINLNSLFEVSFRAGCFQKRSELLKVKKNNIFYDNKINIITLLNFYPNDLWKLYFEFGTSNYFNYPLFFTGIFTFGGEFDLVKNKYSLGIDLTAKFYDMVVNNQDLSQLNVRIFGRYKI